MSSYKIGQKVSYKGLKTVITAINRDGTATLNYAPGSGKTGFAGTLPSRQKQIQNVSLEEILNSTGDNNPLVEKRLSISEENKMLAELNDDLDFETKSNLSGLTVSKKLVDFIYQEGPTETIKAEGKLPKEQEEAFMSEVTSLLQIIDEDKNNAFSKETKIMAGQLKEHYYDYQNIDENGNPKMLYDLDEDYPMLISPKNLDIYPGFSSYIENGEKALPLSISDLAYRAASDAKNNKKANSALNEILEEKLGFSPVREVKQSFFSKIKNRF
jgi:hypothetical protein